MAILEAHGLNKHFGAVSAADNVNALIEAGSVVALIGANGAGKTTFVNMITGYLKPDSGSIRFEGRDITPLPPRSITRLGICRSFQIAQLYDSLTVAENLQVGLGVLLLNHTARAWYSRAPLVVPGHGVSALEAASAIMQRFDLTAHAERPARVLPQGTRKLLDIAMALVAKPRILLLDEPTSGVSAEEKFAIVEKVMAAARAEGVTVLFVEHDMDIVERYAERVLAFYEGRVLADGPPDQVLNDVEVRRYVTGERHAGVAVTAASGG